MALNVGSIQIGSVYLGSILIAEAYYGSTKVYQYTPPNYNQLNMSGQFRDGTNVVLGHHDGLTEDL